MAENAPQIYFMLTDSVTGRCNVDVNNMGYVQMRRLADFSGGVVTKVPIETLSNVCIFPKGRFRPRLQLHNRHGARRPSSRTRWRTAVTLPRTSHSSLTQPSPASSFPPLEVIISLCNAWQLVSRRSSLYRTERRSSPTCSSRPAI